MDKFWVRLQVVIMEYEKVTHMVVEAPDEYEAGSYACYAESHCIGDLDWESERQSLYDDYGGMRYLVDGVKKLTDEEFDVLRKFIPYMKHSQEDLDNSGNYKEES